MSERLKILNLQVDQLSFHESLENIFAWGLQRQQGFICFANVHMTVEADRDPQFREQLSKARLVLTDGKPIATACRWIYGVNQERIAGMDFMPALLQKASDFGARIFLYGSTEEVLQKLATTIQTSYSGATLAGTISPPFRELTEDEIAGHLDTIRKSNAQFVLVALGCPKQEKWMALHFQSIDAILLGLGGAFPVVAGMQKRSPKWMHEMGLEWLYRLGQEPGRLMKRYLVTNSLFIWLLLKQLMTGKQKSRG